jgi:hypothetical protein
MTRALKVTRYGVASYALLISAGLLFFTGSINSVEAQGSDCAYRKINKNQEVVYIQFEGTRVPKNEESRDEVVHFRIRNNTTCEVLLISPDSCLRRVNGVWTSAVEDGEEVNVLYEIETKKGRFQHYRNDQLFVVHLLPGRSCIFPVRSGYLKKASIICVAYRYAWEDSAVGGSSPRCEARFYANDLPRGPATASAERNAVIQSPISVCGIDGFTQAVDEHIINEIEPPFVVKEIKGKILNTTGNGWTKVVRVLFEIREAGHSRIKKTHTDENGDFRIKNISDGRYCFKATVTGWQPVMGIIIVSKQAARKSRSFL